MSIEIKEYVGYNPSRNYQEACKGGKKASKSAKASKSSKKKCK